MDSEERYIRQLGRKMRRGIPGTSTKGLVSRRVGTVESVDGKTITVNFGSTSTPLLVPGVRMLTACSGAKAGDEVLVDTSNHISIAVGILA